MTDKELALIAHLRAENAALREKPLNQLWKPVLRGIQKEKAAIL